MQINSHANLLASVSYIVYNGTKKLIDMLNIKPISDLRNYIEVLKQVDVSNRVYLTRNGHGEYGILTMAGMIFETRSSTTANFENTFHYYLCFHRYSEYRLNILVKLNNILLILLFL